MNNYSPFLYRSEAGYQILQKWYDDTIATFKVPLSSRYVSTRYGQTHTLVAGDEGAPPLVLVSGYGAGAPLWREQIEYFAASRRVYAVDNVGQPGRSAPNVPDLLDDSWPHWLNDVFDALEIEHPEMAGVCLGGWVGMRYAALYPDRLRRLILLSPVGIAPFKIYWRSGVPLILNMRNNPDAAGQRLIRMVFMPPNRNINPNKFHKEVLRALSLVVKHYNAGALAGMSAKPNLAEIGRGTRALLKFVRGESRKTLAKIQTPTLLIIGEHEAIFDPHKAAKRAQKLMPMVQVEIVSDASHAAIYDRADWVNERITRFLKDDA